MKFKSHRKKPSFMANKTYDKQSDLTTCQGHLLRKKQKERNEDERLLDRASPIGQSPSSNQILPLSSLYPLYSAIYIISAQVIIINIKICCRESFLKLRVF